MDTIKKFLSKRAQGLLDNILWYLLYSAISAFPTWGIPKVIQPVRNFMEINIFLTVLGYLLLFCAFWALIYVIAEWIRRIFYKRLSPENILISISPLSNDERAILIISNTHKDDLKNCHAKIIKIRYSKFSTGNQDEITPSNKNLKWESKIQPDGFITIIGRESENLELAWAKKPTLLFGKGSDFGFSYILPEEESTEKKEGNYFVTVKIEGNTDKGKVYKEKSYLVSFYAHRPGTLQENSGDKYRVVVLNEV